MGLLDFAHQDYTPSWYADSAPRLAPQPALRGEVSAEVCVIGGGYTGLSTALELAERGVSVVLLEGARLGWAASGRNGGQVLSDLACGMDAVRAELGAEAARAIWAMTQEAARMVGERCQRYAIDADLHWGYLHAAVKPRQLRELADWQARAARDYGYEALRLVEQAGLSALVDSPRYVGGLFDPNCGHLHPLNTRWAWPARRWPPGCACMRAQPGAAHRAGGVGDGGGRTGPGARRAGGAGRQLPSGRAGADAARAHHAGGHLYHRHRAAGRGARASFCRATMRCQIVILCWIISAARPTIGCCLAARSVIPACRRPI
ncbi:MAG: FAD-binding oxidoreductase [Rivihabitans pingtungensis]